MHEDSLQSGDPIEDSYNKLHDLIVKQKELFKKIGEVEAEIVILLNRLTIGNVTYT